MTPAKVVVTTDRLVLRHLVPEDLESLYALYRDPEIRRYFPDGTRTREETRRELEWLLNGHPLNPKSGLWAVVDKMSGNLVGRCGLLPWQIDGRTDVEVAFMTAKSRWGQGLATEAAHEIVRYAHEALGLHRLVCLIMRGNVASEAVARKIGMRFERDYTDEFGTCSLFSSALPPR